ncbi:Hypothetical protein BAMTRB_011 [Escherichia phage vB_Eco_Bam]|uniref:Uncharacterized protein n=1 Tax=Escherichia phage vB_Eco_Bam TaxID=2898833 RepID=A0A9P0YC92_9CAUD|nr:hypothetical protein MAK_009 [Escherichia phage vB_Eco_Mak]CAH7774583.1 hypothetical protein TITUS_007 [Escherichia phage vB_Eco_Titus]CAI9888934.1 Hypothetical protein BAMTRB_011 [Escherichia phage vB_Eco_Bam]
MKPTIMGRQVLKSVHRDLIRMEYVFVFGDCVTGEQYPVRLYSCDFEDMREGEYKAFHRLCTKLWPEQPL